MKSAFRNGLLRALSRRTPLSHPLTFITRKYAMAAHTHLERFLADKSAPYCSLQVAPSFALLTAKERLYAHHLGQYVSVLKLSQKRVS